MKFENIDRLLRCLSIFEIGLSPYVEKRLKEKYKSEWYQIGVTKPLDKHGDVQWRNGVTPENCWDKLELSDLCWIITDDHNWNSIFSHNNGKYSKGDVHSFRRIRNKVAHPKRYSEEFTNDKILQYLDSMIYFLEGIGNNVETEYIRGLRNIKYQNIPYIRNEKFFGREGLLLDIHSHFFANREKKDQKIILTGMGGVGKTQIALEYAYQNQEIYTDGIFWVDASTNFGSELLKVAKNFISNYLFEKDFNDVVVLQKFSEYLDDNPNTLIIIDNLDEICYLEKSTMGIIPIYLSGHIIITSRERTIQSSINSLEIKGLDLDSAIQLLFSGPSRNKIFAQQDQDSAMFNCAKKICADFGFYPLAISRAAAFLERFPNIAIGDLLTKIRKERTFKTIVEIDSASSNQSGNYETLIKNLFQLMWDSLVNSQSKIILPIMSLFDDLPSVPRSLISLLGGVEDDRKTNVGSPTQMDMVLDELKALRFIDEVVIQKTTFSVNYDRDNPFEYPLSVWTQEVELQFDIHPIIRDFLIQTIPDEQSLVKECIVIYKNEIRNPELFNYSLISKGVDKVLDEFRSINDLLNRSTNKWIDFDSSIFYYQDLLKKESHNLRNWNMVNLDVMVDIPPKWFNPKDLPGFALQQVYNRLFIENNIDANTYFNYLKSNKLPSLCEKTRARADSSFLDKTLSGHVDQIIDMVITRDNQYVISSSLDGTIKVWSINKGKVMHDTLRYENWLLFTAVNSENQRIISNYEDWEKWADNDEFWEQLNSQSSNFERDKSPINSIDGLTASIDDEMAIYIWDSESGNLITRLESDPDFPYDLNPPAFYFSRDNEKIFLQSDKQVVFWRFKDWETELLIESGEDFYFSTSTFDPTRNLVICGDNGGNLKIINIETGLVSTVKNAHNGLISKILIDPNDQFITASQDGLIKVWTYEDGNFISILCFGNNNNSINDIAITSDGDTLTSGHDSGALILWELKTGKLIKTLFSHVKPVTKVIISTDDRQAFSISEDQTIKIWNIAQNTIESDDDLPISDLFKFVVVPNSNYGIGIGSNSAILFDLESNHEISKIEIDHENLKGITLQNDGAQAILYGNWVYQWDFLSDTEPQTIIDNDNENRSFIFMTSNLKWALSHRLNCYQMMEGEEHPQDTIEVWSADTQDMVFSIDVEPHSKRSFFTDDFGEHIIANYSSLNVTEDIENNLPSIEYWNIVENELGSLNILQKVIGGNSLISDDGRYILTLTRMGTEEIRNLHTGELISNLPFNLTDLKPKFLSVTTNDHFALIIYSDGSIHYWDLINCRCKAVLSGSFTYCSITMDGLKVFGIDNNGQVHFLDFIGDSF